MQNLIFGGVGVWARSALVARVWLVTGLLARMVALIGLLVATGMTSGCTADGQSSGGGDGIPPIVSVTPPKPAFKPTRFAPLSTDVSLTATGPASVVAGTSMSYLITVSNGGPDDATGVSVTMTMPSGLSFSSSSGAGWACAAAPDLSCTGPDIPNGTSAPVLTVQFAVASSAAGTITGKPTAGSATADPNAANNMMPVATTVTYSADLNISASGPASVATSSPLTYNITVGNVGPSDAANTTVAVTLPAGMAYNGVAGAGWTCVVVGQAVSCKQLNVAASTIAPPLSILTTTPAAAGTINPAFSVSSGATDPNLADNASSVSTLCIAPLALTPPSANVFPRAAKAFVASGGIAPYTYSMQAAPSGGSIDAAGNYTAGTIGSVLDVVKVTDSVATSATANVNVGAGATITPSAKALAPKQTQTFVGSGGNGSFTYTLVQNQSGATINAGTGAYAAGATGSTTDIVQATDSLGNYAQAVITVGPGVAINPVAPPVTAPKDSITFTAVGGSGGGYVWSVTTVTGATISAAGVYKAGAAGNTTDTVKVTDALGNTASVVVTVGPPLTLSPLAPTISPRGPISFSVSGGSSSGYAFSITVNQSGGSINAATGDYTAGATPSKKDTISVVDSLGNVTTTIVTIGPGVTIVPAAKTTAPKSSINFSASGGWGSGYTYGFIANGSGGTLTAGGAYTAGPTGSKTDTIRVTDAVGNTATATITVSAGVSIIPPNPSVAPSGTVNFTAAGGSASGFSWSLTQNNSGATINAVTGVYKAGPTGTVTDTVAVTDSLGNTASVNVSVGGGLAINPVNPSTTPKGSVTFKVTGGSGMGYVWTMLAAPSGGTIAAGTGAYKAGATGNVTDTVKVTDSLGNVATMNVTVGPGVSIAPAGAALAPLGSASFNATGGSGAGYVWSINPNNSGGSIGATGAYTAGTTGSVSDTVMVTDSLGNVQTAPVTVSAAIAISPSMITLPPRGSQSFGVTGGAGTYSFVMQTNASGGNVSAAGGSYTAGSKGSVLDVVKVTDKNGAFSLAQVTVGPQIGITPAIPQAPPLGAIAFVGSGGSGAPYTWQLLANNSGGSIVGATGAYLAGMTPNVTDTVQVLDALGNVAQVNVSVGSGLTVNPTKATVPPRGPLSFFVRGGSGTGYVWSLEANASGASIDAAAGKYVAGATANVMDMVRVTDAVGAHESIPVAVGPGVTVTPTTTNAPAGSKVSFNVAGGSGMTYVWTIADNQSGAKIDAATGVYVAGSKSNVSDIVSVQDSLHNGASATVHVQPATSTGGTDGGAGGGNLDGGVDADLGEVIVPQQPGGCGCSVIGGRSSGVADSARGGNAGDLPGRADLAGLAGLLALCVTFVARRSGKRRRHAAYENRAKSG